MNFETKLLVYFRTLQNQITKANIYVNVKLDIFKKLWPFVAKLTVNNHPTYVSAFEKSPIHPTIIISVYVVSLIVAVHHNNNIMNLLGSAKKSDILLNIIKYM